MEHRDDDSWSKKTLNELFEKADTDNSGTIDWKEFCVVAANRDNLVSKDSLK